MDLFVYLMGLVCTFMSGYFIGGIARSLKQIEEVRRAKELQRGAEDAAARAIARTWGCCVLSPEEARQVVHDVEDILEWAKPDHVLEFDDGDAPLAGRCRRILTVLTGKV